MKTIKTWIVKLNDTVKMHDSLESAQAAYDRCESYVIARGGSCSLKERLYNANCTAWTDQTIVEWEE